MKNIVSKAVGLAAIAAATPAFAGTVVTTSAGSSAYAAPAGSTTVMTFNGSGSAVTEAASYGYTLTRAGVSWAVSASGSIKDTTDGSANSTSFYFAAPNNYDGNGFYGVGGTTSSGVQSYAQFLGTSALSSISVLIGSLDSYNQISLLGQNGNVLASYTGFDLNGGSTTFPGSQNLRATFTGTNGSNYYGIRFANTGSLGSLEFDNLAFTKVAGPVPEIATWAMMILGFGAVGAAMRRKHTTVVFA